MMEDDSPDLTLRNNFNSDPTANADCLRLPGHHDEPVDQHNGMKWTEKISKTDWCEDPTLQE